MRFIDILVTEDFKEGNGVFEKTTQFCDQQRDEQNKTEFKRKDLEMSSKKSYSLIFNHLTSRVDGMIPLMDGTIDQALITLHKAFDKSLEETKASFTSKVTNAFKGKAASLNNDCYSDIQLKLKQVDLARINCALFNPDKEFKDLTRESALTKLKEESSYGHAWFGTRSLSANLRITSIDERQLEKKFEDKQINELIAIITNQPIDDSNLRFYIVIKKANENDINKLFTSKSPTSKSIKLNIQFDKLDLETAKAKFSINKGFVD